MRFYPHFLEVYPIDHASDLPAPKDTGEGVLVGDASPETFWRPARGSWGAAGPGAGRRAGGARWAGAGFGGCGGS